VSTVDEKLGAKSMNERHSRQQRRSCPHRPHRLRNIWVEFNVLRTFFCRGVFRLAETDGYDPGDTEHLCLLEIPRFRQLESICSAEAFVEASSWILPGTGELAFCGVVIVDTV
jgi:hypothetical protein